NEGTVAGLAWNPETGPDAVRKASNPPYGYQIGIYLRPDLESAYSAALQGFATFQPLSTAANGHIYEDLRLHGELLGTGPPSWITVSSGFSTSTNSVLMYGPQLEFIDAVRDTTWYTNPSVAMSFCAN